MGKDYSPPEPSPVDRSYEVAREVVDLIPGGGAAMKLFEFLLAPPLEKRRHEWMESVAEGLRALEARGRIDLDELPSNETFIDTSLQTSAAALRTSQKEKLQALRNAMLNAALPHAPDASRQQIFVNLIESLTVWHLRILHLFADPVEWFKSNKRQLPEYVISSHLERLLIDAYPELKDQQPLYDKITKDLYQSGLLGSDGLRVMMSAGGAFEKRTTVLGGQFLQFISDPDPGAA